LRIIVLGSGAGGGVPQWNCRCRICAIARSDPHRVKPRTETSLAVSADGVGFIILDAAPEMRQQILATPALWPRGLEARQSPVAAVVLTSGDVDHVAGLLCLREGHPFELHATPSVLENLTAPVFDVLRPRLVARRPLRLDQPVHVAGLAVTPFAVPGKVPLYREREEVAVGDSSDAVVGLEVSDGRHRLAYVPGVAHLSDALRDRLSGADLLFFDGTTYTDHELVTAGLSTKTAGRMGHLAMSGPAGSLAAFAGQEHGRRFFIHLNNSNPVLLEDSAERADVMAHGWSVAHDGLEITL
jgi:pyrroloquinoline quinone biosynthesis protein B